LSRDICNSEEEFEEGRETRKEKKGMARSEMRRRVEMRVKTRVDGTQLNPAAESPQKRGRGKTEADRRQTEAQGTSSKQKVSCVVNNSAFSTALP
jgi:hypothetical protein